MEKKSRRRKGASQTAKRFPPLQNHCEFKVPRQADVMLRLLCLLQIPPGVNTTMCTVSRNGLWTVDSGLWTVDCGIRIADQSQWMEIHSCLITVQDYALLFVPAR